jgi:hypothetical protein
MIRPFDWRDVGLLRRVRDLGLCLDSNLECTRGPRALQTALLNPLTPRKKTCTLVARPDEADQLAAIGQFTRIAQEQYARLTFLGPIPALSQPNGMALIDALSHTAGRYGLHHLLAEVDEKSPVFESLRRAGFAVYARQRIWHLPTPPQKDDGVENPAWRRETSSDVPAIQSLYHDLVPALVQQVEPPPTRNKQNLVHWEQSELRGFVDIEYGRRGIWAQPYFHPAAVQIDDLLASFLTELKPSRRAPLHVCVRSYQAGMSESLDRLGFTPKSDQAVMVKRLTARVRRTARSPLPAIEGTQPEPTAPFAQISKSSSVYQESPLKEPS